MSDNEFLDNFIIELKQKNPNSLIKDYLTPQLERYFIIQFLIGMGKHHLKSDRPDNFKQGMNFAYTNVADQVRILKYAATIDSERQQIIELASYLHDKEINFLIKFGYNQVVKRLLQKIHYDACNLNKTVREFLNFIDERYILQN